MKGDPLISVVLITYNRELSIIKRSIDSIISQTYKNIQIIVVDTNTKQCISEQILKYVAFLDKGGLQLKSLPGLSSNKARNEGFKVSKGEYIAFLDDDDEWAPDKLEKQLDSFDEGVSLVYSNYIISDQYNNECPFFKDIPDTDNLNTKILGENIIGCTSIPLIKRQAFIDARGFNDSFKANQEWDLWIRILQDHKIRYSPAIAGTKYYSGVSVSNNKLRRISGWSNLFIHHASKYHKNKKQLRKALGFFIGEMFENRMYITGMTVLPLYIILKNIEDKKQQ